MDRSLALAIGISVLASVAFAAQGYESLQRVTASNVGVEHSRSAFYVEDGYDSSRSAAFVEDGYDRTNGYRLS